MKKKLDSETEEVTVYQIRIKGHLDSGWSDWFGGMTLTREEKGQTLLTGPVVDQAALYGVLKNVRNLGLTLISVYPAESVPTADGDSE